MAWLLLAALSAPSFAGVIAGFEFRVPPTMVIHQRASSDGTEILGLTAAQGYVNLFARPSRYRFDPDKVFLNGARLIGTPSRVKIGELDWWVAETVRHYPQRRLHVTVYSTVFYTEQGGSLIYGVSRNSSRTQALVNAEQLLTTVRRGRSLTGPEYTGKKYYFGFGAAMPGDPSMMHNEVKYDVRHTHDIFTDDVGGDYIGTALIGPSTATRTAILNGWKKIKDAMTEEDMFVQYSSGHGSSSGLAVGVNYNEIRDNALSLPAQEIIIFTMSCYSGNLVESFKAKQSVWQDWQSQGRTLMVMASSKKSQTSSTGPGTDPDEEGGPYGSAGSAFGHALWKSLIGYADGFIDGVEDGFLSLEEIEKFTIHKTYEVGGHTPVTTGAYSGSLIMNKVPPKAWVEKLDRSSRLSDDDLARQLQELDQALRVQRAPH